MFTLCRYWLATCQCVSGGKATQPFMLLIPVQLWSWSGTCVGFKVVSWEDLIECVGCSIVELGGCVWAYMNWKKEMNIFYEH